MDSLAFAQYVTLIEAMESGEGDLSSWFEPVYEGFVHFGAGNFDRYGKMNLEEKMLLELCFVYYTLKGDLVKVGEVEVVMAYSDIPKSQQVDLESVTIAPISRN